MDCITRYLLLKLAIRNKQMINKMKKWLLVLHLFSFSVLLAQRIEFKGTPELFLPDFLSTDKSEIKITFSPDGSLMLWGTIGWENGIGGWDIWQSEKTADGWSKPKPASFNSKENDFDPCFSPDGKAIYFFSNRPGGFGGDDIYYASYDAGSKTFGAPINMGAKFNTKGDEWGPSFSADGNTFIYCTDGFNGKGAHDVYISYRMKDGWSNPVNIEAINSPEDDFDPLLLNNGGAIIFTRKHSEDEALLYISFLKGDKYTTPVPVSDIMNVKGTWNLGSSLDPLDNSNIYYSTYNEKNGKGRMDIYKIKYALITH